MAEKAGLIERLKQSKWSDRELDYRIAIEVGDIAGPFDADDIEVGDLIGANVGRFTSSLDAIVSLIERELPDWQFGFEKWRPANGGAQAWVYPNQTTDRVRAASPALALCIAFLEARQHQETP